MKKLSVLVAGLGLGALVLAGCTSRERPSPAASRTSALTGLQIVPISAPRSDKSLIYVGGKPLLPKWKTQAELNFERLSKNAKALGQPFADQYDDYRNTNIANFFITQPPTTTTIRPVAEYEESQAYLVAWQNYSTLNTFFLNMIKAAWGKVPVLMAYKDAAAKTWIEGQLTAGGLTGLNDPANIIWWQVTTDAIWTRDFGPISIVTTDTAKKLSFVDFRYYHQRVHDDEVPAKLAAAWGINDFRPDIEFEGGNFMNTDDGLCAASKVVLSVNLQYNQAAIEDIFKKYVACKKIIFPTPVIGDGTGHIDMFAKFGSKTAVMVGKYTAAQDASSPGKGQNVTVLDQNAALFAATTNGSGGTITVTRIPMANWGQDSYGYFVRTYTNSTSLASATTKTVVVPVFSNETSNEADAMSAYATVFPGWTVVKVDSKDIISWGGAVHCVTMQIPAGAKSKMEADPAALCGQKWECAAPPGCGNITDEGCCEGETLKYCYGGKLYLEDCTTQPKCGWDSSYAWYACGTAGGADPSGTLPKDCSAIGDLGPKLDTKPPPDQSTGCGNITYEGCCDGQQILKYCDGGKLVVEDCSTYSGWPTKTCGWSTTNNYYGCNSDYLPDPSGKHPLACPGTTVVDLGPKLDTKPPPVSDGPQKCTLSYEGCCDGNKVYYCTQAGTLAFDDCSTKPQCGWDAGNAWYDCGTSGGADPSGKVPKDCPWTTKTDMSVTTDQKVPKPDTTKPQADTQVPPKPDQTVVTPDMPPILPDSEPPIEDTGAPPKKGDTKTPPKKDDGGCSCSVTSQGSNSPLALLLLGLGVLVFRRRRR